MFNMSEGWNEYFQSIFELHALNEEDKMLSVKSTAKRIIIIVISFGFIAIAYGSLLYQVLNDQAPHLELEKKYY